MPDVFSPATWHTTYDLAGATWKPEVCDDSLLINPDGTLLPSFRSGRYIDGTAPLLPSPDEIARMAKAAGVPPRAVAIAALERCGFAHNADIVWIAFGANEPLNTAIRLSLHILARPPQWWLSHQWHDPALAQYAVDCFLTLHAWAAAIQWTPVTSDDLEES
jgi:hypothetical protein